MIGIGALYTAKGLVAYALVFILAATPWIELLVVIPPGIAIGLNPLAVFVLALAGNLTTVYLLVLAYKSLHSIWIKFKINGNESIPSRRKHKALRIWNNYGLPGLAIVSPIIGTHFAALIALSLGSRKHSVIVWMSVSIIIWTIVVTIISYYGIESMKWLLR